MFLGTISKVAFLRLIYLIEFLSLSLSLSLSWSVSHRYLTLRSVFIARVERRTWARCEMRAADLFLRASRITTSFPRVCIDGVTEWREAVVCRTCYTRVRERHVPLGAASRPRLMFQRCRVRRRSCCSLYHRDLGGINRETRLFDRDQRARIPEVYLLHRVTSYLSKTFNFDWKNMWI